MNSDGPLIECGFVLKPRKLATSWVAHASPAAREIWDWLCRSASHRQRRKDGFVLERGQLFCRYKDIRDALYWNHGYRTEYYSESQVKGAMKRLMNEGMIKLVKRPRGNLITICKYDFYQSAENYEATGVNSNKASEDDRQSTNTHSSINKNEKNERNEEGELVCSVPEAGSEHVSDVFVSIPLKGEGAYDVLETDLERWKQTYPNVDVCQQLLEIAEWNRANVKKRKTRPGMPKHIVNWLAGQQNDSKAISVGDGLRRSEKCDPLRVVDRFR